MLKTCHGSCHCGAVRFEADLDLAQSTYRCNCSICRRTRFSKTRKNQHYFCRHCGVRAFGVGTETPIGRMYGVNLGCLTDVTDEALSRLTITYVDGLHDRWQEFPEFFRHL